MWLKGTRALIPNANQSFIQKKKNREMETENKKMEMKHLGFMRVVGIQAIVCVSNLYEYAKQNSGPLKSTVGIVEGALTAVMGPVYEKLTCVPDDILVFADKKVDKASHKFDEHAPTLAKQVASQVHCLINTAFHKAQKLVSEAQTEGPRAALHYVKVWVKLTNFALFHSIADVTVPTAAHWSEKYNHVVKDMNKKGYTVFSYHPLVPVDQISKAFKETEAKQKVDETEKDSSSNSD